ncbi:hypothetical protein KHP62_09960 [Rhodobacteraceae bacterium NNCM2]|nr:hypothetical protein [Coraliihabitans acroporae]
MTISERSPQFETVPPGEAETIAAIVSSNFRTLSRERGIVRRGQHAKTHCCAAATFTVLPEIPKRYRHGVFAEERSFDAIVRFSNGKEDDDRKPDAHGMAIKLTNVPGAKLMDAPEADGCQDFILADHPVFFVSGIEEYQLFSRHFGNLLGFTRNRRGLLRFVGSLLSLKLVHRGLARRAKAFSRQTPSSPLKSHYWSTTPYLLGQSAVKYMAISPRADDADAQSGVGQVDGLARALAAQLADGPVTFTFGVHVASDPARHPVEDPTVNWAANGAEFVPLARVEIARQQVDPGRKADENLVFSPWHARAEHRPIGSVNRVRKVVYAEMSRKRRQMNGVST